MAGFTGYIYAGVAALMFGVQYLPVKKYEIFDGTTFQWFMCNGVLMIGSALSIATSSLDPDGSLNIEIIPLCILGGAIWALSNYLVIPLVRLLGLGLGFGLYHFVNLMVGYGVGRFGLFGVKKMDPQLPNGLLFCDIGCGILLVGFVIMVLVESGGEGVEDVGAHLPRMVSSLAGADEDDFEDYRQKYRNWRLGEARGAKHPIGNFVVQAVGVKQFCAFRFGTFGLNESPVDEEVCFEQERALAKGLPEKEVKRIATEPALMKERLLDDDGAPPASGNGLCQRLSGIMLAVVAGALCGLNSVPASLYTQVHKGKGPFAPLFSQCFGIWLTSTLIYIAYSSIARLIKWPVPHSVIRPALVSGCLWTVGYGCMLGGIEGLGYSIGYTLDAVGPVAVSSIISIVVYKEITGTRKLLMFSASLTCQLLGVGLIAVFGA